MGIFSSALPHILKSIVYNWRLFQEKIYMGKNKGIKIESDYIGTKFYY